MSPDLYNIAARQAMMGRLWFYWIFHPLGCLLLNDLFIWSAVWFDWEITSLLIFTAFAFF
jgi:hypothetical protein